jgi:hypothetical protein
VVDDALAVKVIEAMKIEDYHFGSIKVDGETYSSDVIISPESVDASWWRERGHEVSCKDLEPVLEARPDAVVIGTGAYGVMKVTAQAAELLRKRGIQAHVLPTAEAWKRYNELVEKGHRAVAALHLTC